MPKNGKFSEIENYRGKAIQSVASKVLDKLITKRLYEGFYPKIPETQHGFSTGRSIVTNLIKFTQNLQEALYRNAQVGVI